MRRIAKSLQILVVQTLAFTTEPSSYSPMVVPDAADSSSSPKTAFPDSPFKTIFPPSRDSSRRGTPAAVVTGNSLSALESLDPYLPRFLKRVLRHPNRLYYLNELFHRLSKIRSLKTEKSLARMYLDQNRYVDVLPFDHSLVRLSDGAYINASWVHTTIQYNNTLNTTINGNVNYDSKWYIVAQAPLPHTLHLFWQMVAENGVRVIVCLTRLEEAGREKCTQYWPNSQEEPLLLSPNYKLWLVRQSLLFEGLVVHRELCLEGYGKGFTVHQLHYLGWPDQGVPTCTRAVTQMAVLSKQLSAQLNDIPAAPVLVHCSAGIGRSGAYCAIDSVMESISLRPNLLEEHGEQNEEEDLILKAISEMRKWRPYLVQNWTQFAYCYDALTHWMQERVESALSVPTNIGEEVEEDEETLPMLTLNEDSLLNEEEVMSIVSEYDGNDEENDDGGDDDNDDDGNEIW